MFTATAEKTRELPGPHTLRYLARQPILDLRENVFGYELLFRGGSAGFLSAINSDRASMTTMDSSLLLGAASLTGGKRAFINCTRELLVSGLVTLLPADLTVLEVLEDVVPDLEVLQSCRKLRTQGYSLAMDDFIARDSGSPLLELVKYVKVDLRATTRSEQKTIARQLIRRGITLVAEKVETREDFDFVASLGYTFFQGYFFCRPVTLATRDIPTTAQTHLRLLQQSQAPELDILGLEKIIRPEVALCYRLLRYLNSAAFGLYPVRSIRHALSLLGEREVRKWVALVTTAMLAQNKPAELVRMAMVRGHFCENFAPPDKQEDYFLAGLFSLLEAMLDRPMDHLVHDLPISEPCRVALLGGDNHIAQAIRICQHCERAEFDQTLVGRDQEEADHIWARFHDSTLWSEAVLSSSL
jgi:c-di-GMP-related signal transduction protein